MINGKPFGQMTLRYIDSKWHGNNFELEIFGDCGSDNFPYDMFPWRDGVRSRCASLNVVEGQHFYMVLHGNDRSIGSNGVVGLEHLVSQHVSLSQKARYANRGHSLCS